MRSVLRTIRFPPGPKTRSMTAAFSAEPDLKYLAEVPIEA
jgi:hypothetical protein